MAVKVLVSNPYLYNYKGRVIEVIDGRNIMISVDCGFNIYYVARCALYHIKYPDIYSQEFKQLSDWLRNRLTNIEVILRVGRKFRGWYGVILWDIHKTLCAFETSINMEILKLKLADGYLLPYDAKRLLCKEGVV